MAVTSFTMKRTVAVLPFALVSLSLTACRGNPENSAACGFASVAAGSLVMQSLQDLSHAVNAAPSNVPDTLPGKVVGHGTTRLVKAGRPDSLVLQFEGPDLPKIPGFGLLLVDDSLEVVRGVLIFEPEAPPGFNRLGTVVSETGKVPLLGLRVHWPSLNAPRCPMFQPVAGDSTGR
jgi:hypothetical protein